MKTILMAALCVLTFSLTVQSQSNIDAVVNSIEQNNNTLMAFRKQTDAQKIQNKTGIYLQNPEIGFNYLWGNSALLGNRIDYNIMQSFDFPSAYHYKSKRAGMQNSQAELTFQNERKTILLQAQNLCIELVYANILHNYYAKRLQQAQLLNNSSKAKFDKGEISLLDYNKSRLFLLTAQKEFEANEIDRNALLSQLATLNGGNTVVLNDTVFVAKVIPPDFEQWYAIVAENNPSLQWIRQENEISSLNIKLNTALSLPRFTMGYMSEKNVGQQFQGITVGLSVPLWENKNTIKFAKANTLAMQSMETDWKLTFYNKLKTLHAKAYGLQKTVDDYRSTLSSVDNYLLLKKALDTGEISLIEYLMEMSLYYTSINHLLQYEKEWQKVIAELMLYQ